MSQDTVANLYDFPAREYGTQGRWPSPDPAGLAAVNPTNPQSWNRYGYASNNPLAFTDPLGLYIVDCAWTGCPGSACFMCGGGGGATGPDGPGYGGQAPGVYIDGMPQNVFNTSGLGFNSIAGLLPNNCTWSTCTVMTRYGIPVTFWASQMGDGGFGGCDGILTCWTFALYPADSFNAAIMIAGVGYWGPAYGGPVGARLTVAHTGSVIISWPGVGLGPAFTGSYVPSQNLVCGGGGIGASVGHNVSVGPQLVDANNAQNILSGLSFSAGYNSTPFQGAQGSINFNGSTGGYSAGFPGASASATFSWCGHF